MKAGEAKLETDKQRLKAILEASESRCTQVELSRRALEGELQRARLGLSDRQVELQGLRDRVDALQRQVLRPGLSPRLAGG